MVRQDQFADWQAICEAKARYCRFLDTKQWDDWEQLFTEDYELDVSEESGIPPIKGRSEAIGMVKQAIRDVVTTHQVHTPEITIDGDVAHVIWAMQDRLATTPQGPWMTGFGHYHETWRRDAGRWRIATLKLTRLQVEHTPAKTI